MAHVGTISERISESHAVELERIVRETGLTRREALDSALEVWKSVPKRVRDKVLRERFASRQSNDRRRNRADRVSA